MRLINPATVTFTLGWLVINNIKERDNTKNIYNLDILHIWSVYDVKFP